VRAALRRDRIGLADHWLRRVQEIREKHASKLASLPDEASCIDRLCELNVIEQVVNVCETTICHAAWQRDQELTVHGWIYGLHNGLLRDLDVTVNNIHETAQVSQMAISTLNDT
jgi:carbonic anhydrase